MHSEFRGMQFWEGDMMNLGYRQKKSLFNIITGGLILSCRHVPFSLYGKLVIYTD